MFNKKLYCLVFIVVFFLSLNVIYALDSSNQTYSQSNETSEILTHKNITVDAVKSADVSKDLKQSNSSFDLSKTIQSGDISKYYNSKTSYSAVFLDSNGEVLKNTKVKITVNKHTYVKKTNSNGVVSLKINFKPGTYRVTANNSVTGFSLVSSFKILSTINALDISKVYKDNRKFYATFLKSNGNPLVKKTVKFKLNGKTYKVKTNSNGVAGLSLKNLKKGTYKIISYNIDKLTKTNKIKVVKFTSTKLTTYYYTFLKSDKSKIIKVKLLNKFGYAPSKGKVIKFKVNGKTYSAKTSSNGFAKIKLPALKLGTYTVKYSFQGNSYYKKSSVSNKITIIPTRTPTFTLKSPTNFKYGDNNMFKVALSSGSVPLAKRTVTFSVAGNNYNIQTDSKGIASIPISLGEGNYYISYSNAPESNVNSISQSTFIEIIDKNLSKITWESGDTFYQGTQYYKISLKDYNNNPLINKNIQLTIGSTTFTSITSTLGYATFTTNLSEGQYSVSYKWGGEADYKASQGALNIMIIKKDLSGNGYWMYGSDMGSVDFDMLLSQSASDLFINSQDILNDQQRLEAFISTAKIWGVRVHIWMPIFYSLQSGWVNPILNGKINQDFFDEKIEEATTYASIKGVSGIYMDYLRYPGNAYQTNGGSGAIDVFTKEITEAIHKVNSNLIVSCAVMPDTVNNAYYYGQNYTALSKYCDVVIPTLFRDDFGKNSTWVKNTAKWFVENSNGANVWVGLQGYQSNSSIVKLPLSEITNDVQLAFTSKSSGTVIFRWGQTNYVNFKNAYDESKSINDSLKPFNNTNKTSNSTLIPVHDIVTSAVLLNSYIISYNALPDNIKVGNEYYTMSEFLYLMCRAVEFINEGKDNIQHVKSDEPTNQLSTAKSGNIYLSQYLEMAFNITSFIENYGTAPNYSNSPLGYIKYGDLVEIYSKILSNYNTNNLLPNYIAFEVENQQENKSTSLSINNIVSGAIKINTYYNLNKVYPALISIGNNNLTLPEFLYVVSQAIYQISDSNFNEIEPIFGLKFPSSPSGDVIKDKWYLSNYKVVARNVANYIRANNRSPNYVSSNLGNIMYFDLIDSFLRILEFYGKNMRLPSYVSFSS